MVYSLGHEPETSRHYSSEGSAIKIMVNSSAKQVVFSRALCLFFADLRRKQEVNDGG